jgi:tRNA(Ile)-lysidine synthase
MLRVLAEQVRRFPLVSPSEIVVVAVSGGADSVALLHLLDELRRDAEFDGRLIAAHLNHGLRGPESDTDEAFVQSQAAALGIACVVDRRDVARIATQRRIGLEEAGRHERYAFFERVCIARGARAVALAHHADDPAETILHRVLRGTGLRGLAGMPVSRPLTPGSDIRLIRPLLSCTRAELRQYLIERGLAYREDRTNFDPGLTRNRIRHAVMPLLEETINPQVRGALLRLGEQARWFEDYFEENVARTLESLLVSRTNVEIVLNAPSLMRKSRLMQSAVVREAYAALGAGEGELAFGHLVAVVELLDDAASGKKIELPGGVTAEKRYDQLILTNAAPSEPAPPAEPVVLRVPGKTVVSSRRLEIVTEWAQPGPGGLAALRQAGERMSEHVDFGALHPPLLVRSRRSGERFTPLGAPGTKKLSDYLTDAKVPPEQRRNIVVVCDQLGPIWIVGHRIDDRVKLTSQTRRVLHLQARDLRT